MEAKKLAFDLKRAIRDFHNKMQDSLAHDSVQDYEKPTRYSRGQSVILARQFARSAGLPKSCLPKDTHKATWNTACHRNGDAFSFLALIGIVPLRA